MFYLQKVYFKPQSSHAVKQKIFFPLLVLILSIGFSSINNIRVIHFSLIGMKNHILDLIKVNFIRFVPITEIKAKAC